VTDTRHQQDRNEHRDQRQAHGDHGETDLACAEHGGFARTHARFQMSHDVFKNDHGVVHDETGGDRQSHQRKIVDAVTEQVHRSEAADDRQRQDHGGYQCGPAGLQEHIDHRDHQEDGQPQAALGVVDRRSNGL
jgi:hypothetical protein